MHHVHVLHGVGGIVERGKRIVLVVKHRVPRFASCYVVVVIHRSIGGVVYRGNRIVLINIGRIVSLIVALWQFCWPPSRFAEQSSFEKWCRTIY